MNTTTIHTRSDDQELARFRTTFTLRMQHLDRCLEGLKVPESSDTARGDSNCEPDPEILRVTRQVHQKMQHLADTLAKG